MASFHFPGWQLQSSQPRVSPPISGAQAGVCLQMQQGFPRGTPLLLKTSPPVTLLFNYSERLLKAKSHQQGRISTGGGL